MRELAVLGCHFSVLSCFVVNPLPPPTHVHTPPENKPTKKAFWTNISQGFTHTKCTVLSEFLWHVSIVLEISKNTFCMTNVLPFSGTMGGAHLPPTSVYWV